MSKSIEASKMKNESFSCIVLGNSMAMDGIDTQFLTNKGIDSYNMAIGGANLYTSYFQLENYLLNNNKPKIVLLGLGSSLKDYSKKTDKTPKLQPITSYVYGQDKLSFESLPLVKFKWIATETLKKIISKNHREARIVLGQLRIKRTVKDNSKYLSCLKRELNIDDYVGTKYFFKIDSICRVEKIKLQVFEMPGFKNTQNDIPIESHLIKSTKEDIKLLNFNNRKLCAELFIDDKDWLGNSHLNKYGAEKFTKYLYEKYLINMRE